MDKLHIALQPAVTNLRASWILPDGFDVIYTPEHIAPLFHGDRLTLYAILARRKDIEAASNGKRSRRSSSESVKEFWFEVLQIFTFPHISSVSLPKTRQIRLSISFLDFISLLIGFL